MGVFCNCCKKEEGGQYHQTNRFNGNGKFNANNDDSPAEHELKYVNEESNKIDDKDKKRNENIQKDERKNEKRIKEKEEIQKNYEEEKKEERYEKDIENISEDDIKKIFKILDDEYYISSIWEDDYIKSIIIQLKGNLKNLREYFEKEI